MKYEDINHEEIVPWVKTWTNPLNKFRVLAIHYSADPDKDPNRDWAEWYAQERKWMPKDKWNKEYELDFASKSWQLIFGSEYCDFNPSVHFIQSFDVKWELLFSLDFGQSNPNAWYIGCYDKHWILYIIDEYYKPAIPSVATREMFDKFSHHMWTSPGKLKQMDVDEKRDLFRNTFQIAVIDPTTRAKNRTTYKDGEEIPFSVVEDFYDNWMEFDLWNNNWDSWITRIREYFQIDEKWRSHIYIFQDKCPNLCDEIVKYKYKEQTESQERTTNKSERPVKKHDHGVDSLRYMIMTRPNKPVEFKEELTIVQKDMQRFLKPPNIAMYWDQD